VHPLEKAPWKKPSDEAKITPPTANRGGTQMPPMIKPVPVSTASKKAILAYVRLVI